jgi:hypothetical protein
MSDRHTVLWAALALALSTGAAQAQSGDPAATVPVTEAACFDLTQHFRICPARTDWALARWVQFADGSALEGDDLWLEFTESWAARRDGETLDQALDGLLAQITEHARLEQFDDFTVLLTDLLQTDTLQVARAIYRIELRPDPPLLIASMIAEGAGQRINLMVGHIEVVDDAQIERTARDLAELIHPIVGR